MKKIILIGFILFFCFNCFALSLDTNSVDYIQGETIYFFGSCTPEEKINLTALNGIKKVFSNEIICSTQGNYSFEYDSSFIDPPGKWIVNLFSGAGSIQKVINVSRAREASFYLISFLSPASREINKASELDLVVKVTDKGQAVNEAEVYFFDLIGNKKQMNFVSDGVYSFKYNLSFDLNADSWNLLVLAQKKEENGLIGGANEMNLALNKAVILIDFIEPFFDSQDLSVKNSIPVKIKVNYLNEKPLINPKINLVVNEKEFLFNQLSETEFFFDFIPEITDLGLIVLKVNAVDGGGNTASKTKSIQTTGELIFILKQNILLILFVSVILIGLIFVFSNKFISFKSINSLEKEEKDLIKKIKDLQEDYFLNQKLNPEQYKKILAQYNSKLSSVKEKKTKLKNNLN